ncbi:MAG: hypothetical protein KF850_07365 [Labilithrix sp.]|nr:hypothetical protein [Labilithrix sp.]
MSGRSSSVPAARASRPAASARAVIAARAPEAAARATAKTVALGEAEAASVASIAAALPDPASLTPGTLVVVPGALQAERARGPLALGRTLARSVLSVLGRPQTVTRARRCSALVARGYVDVGAAEDELRADLAWGYAPPAPPHEEATPDDVP